MGIGVQYFIFEENGQVIQVPQKRFLRIADGQEPYHQAAGKYLRFAEMAIEFENRIPTRIIRAVYSKLNLDEDGFNRRSNDFQIVPDLLTELPSLGQESGSGNTNVVDFMPRWAEMEKRKRKWVPAPTDLAALREFLPGLI